MNFKELLKWIDGEVLIKTEETKFNKLSTDTRKIETNNIFLALKGENFNGNKYVKEAFDKGASIVIIDEVLIDLNEMEGKGTIIKVRDTSEALLSLAKEYRKKLNIKVVGITGSTGKTSTKDLVAAFLSGKYKVFKTKGNFNNHIGLPLMILELDSSYDVAVLELGMSNLGEIHTLAECARPDIAIITNVGLSHIENLKTRENILKAKLEIVDFFDDNNLLIVNAEDDYLKNLTNMNYKIIKTGLQDGNDYVGSQVTLGEDYTSFTSEADGVKYVFKLPMIGAHNVLNALLAIATSRALDVTYEEMSNSINNIENTSMRLEFIQGEKFTIINDCYNASPDSMKAALDVLKSRNGKRKIAILGTMNELGEVAKEAHNDVGQYAADKVDLLIVTGDYKEDYKMGYEREDIIIYNRKDELITSLRDIVKKDDIVLVKASRGIKFEEIVNELKKLNEGVTANLSSI